VIVVTNRIPVAPGHESDFEARFRLAARGAETRPGFIRNEVHRPRPMKFDNGARQFVPNPQQQAYYEVKTWWRSFEDFEDWTRSAEFAEKSREPAPRKMFAGPDLLDVHEVFIESPYSGNL
jgi:heme-degrading monooxygenase HmoA